MGLTDTRFNLIEVKSDNGRDYYVEGFISTTDPDLYNDIVTEEAQVKILRQLLNQDITMDEDHDVWRDPETGEPHSRPQNKIPAAKVVHAELRELEDGSVGTWVKVMLNKDYPIFDKLLNSIKNGFVHSFSIAYNVIKDTPKKIGDEIFRVISDLNVFNVGITGVPVNPNAKFQLALKSLNKKMTENKELETKVESLTTENAELKSQLEAAQTELKSANDAITANEASAAEKAAELKSVSESTTKELAELKSKVESHDKLLEEVAELKSTLEKVRSTPATGAEIKSQTQAAQEASEVSFVSLM